MDRAEKELLRKHATELKLQPKSLKVGIYISNFYTCHFMTWKLIYYSLSFL
jgi:hypothetical protein